MLKIIAKHHLKTDCVKPFLALMEQLVCASRMEAGNLGYELLCAKEDPLTYTLVETWQDEDAIRLHNQTPHFTSLVPQIASLVDTQPEVILYTYIL